MRGAEPLAAALPLLALLAGSAPSPHKVQPHSRVTVATAKGLHCEAPISASTFSSEQRQPLTCSDGRTGELVTQRERPGNGTAVATLSDGTRAQFVWGKDMRYEDAFPAR